MIIKTGQRKMGKESEQVHTLDEIVESDGSHDEKVRKVKEFWNKEPHLHKFIDTYTVESRDAIILRNDDYATKIPITKKGKRDLEEDISFKKIQIRAGAGKLTALEDTLKDVNKVDERYLTMENFPENFRQLLDDANGALFAEAAIYSLLGLVDEYQRVREKAKRDKNPIPKVNPENINLLNTLFNTSDHPRTDNAAKDCAKQIISYCDSNLGAVPQDNYYDREVEDARENFDYVKKGLKEMYLSDTVPKENVIACAWDFNLENLLRKGNRIAIVDQKGDPENIYFNPALCAGMLVNNLEVAIASKDHIGTTQFKENAQRIVDNLNKIYQKEPGKHNIFVNIGKGKGRKKKLTDLFTKDSISLAFNAGYVIAQTRYVRITYAGK